MAVNNNLQQSRRIGSGFTNLQRIMGANVGSRLGQAVGGGIQQTGEQARQKFGQAQEQFKQEAQAGRLDRPEARQRVESVLAAPGEATESDIQAFGRFRAGQYAGPQGLKDEQGLQAQAQEAQALGRAVGTSGGRTALLQRYAAGPRQYQAGQQRLDELLLGTTGGQQLRQARRAVAGLGQELKRGQEAAQEIARQYGSEAKGFGEEVTRRTGALEGEALGAAQTKIEGATKADEETRLRAEAARRLAAEGKFSQADLEALGLTAGQKLYGANIADFIKYQGRGIQEQIRPEEVMTQEEFKKFSNLRRLMGGDISEFDPTKVGAYKAGQVQYDVEGAKKALGEREALLGSERGAVQAAQDINRLAQGGITDYELSNMRYDPVKFGVFSYQEAARRIGKGINEFTEEDREKLRQTPEYKRWASQELIKQKWPGAVTGGVTRTDWAASNLAAAQQRLREREQQVGLGTAQVINPQDLENMPTVS